MYCFDTSIIVGFFRGDENLNTKINQISKLVPIFITPITLCELYKGLRPIEIVEGFILSTNVKLLNFNPTACKIFGEAYIDLKKKGRLIPEPDLMIASMAKANDLTLVTRE